MNHNQSRLTIATGHGMVTQGQGKGMATGGINSVHSSNVDINANFGV